MSRPGMANLAFYAFAALLILLCAGPLFYAGTTQHVGGRSHYPPPRSPLSRRQQDARSTPEGSDPVATHGDAPPEPFPVELSARSLVAANNAHHTLGRRGALRCDDGPCIDGSCCSKDHICGYGPDYCGAGNCLSQCNATAMCGEYSENAEMPCGMKLCCSGMGWCGVSDDVSAYY